MIAIGGNDSIQDNSPVCGGQYNTTDGGMVSFTYSIQTFPIILNS